MASLTGLVLISGVRAYRSAHSGASLMAEGIRLIGAGDSEAGDRQLQRAERSFHSAASELHRWWVRPVERVPLLNRQFSAADVLAASGGRLAAAGRRLAADAPIDDLRMVDGTMDTAAVARLEAPLEVGLVELRQAHDELSRARGGWLLAPLDRRLTQAIDRLRADIARGETALQVARVVPGLFGADGLRRYFLAILTPAEPRASGGMIGNFGEITAEGGRLRLDRLGRTTELNEGGEPPARTLAGPADYLARYGRFQPDRTWQNVTMSPDFPSVAEVIDGLYPQSGGQPVDGVVGIDPFALAALLKLTGPVSVPGWPEPLTADNATDILLRQQYLRFEVAERVDFLDATARGVFERLTTMSLPSFPAVAAVLGPAVRSRHLMLWSGNDSEQGLFERAGATGALPEVRGDFLAAVVQDATGSKLGAFLRRSIDYRAVLDPDSGLLRGEAVVRLENQAPSSGLPQYVTGPGSSPGHHRVYFSLYTPLVFQGATVDGRPLLMESQRERSRHVYSAFVTIPPGQSTTLVVRLAGEILAGDEYRLDIARQPSIAPDHVDVEVQMGGRGVAAADGLDVRGDIARGHFELSADRAIRLRAHSAVTGPGGGLQLMAVSALVLCLGAHLLRWRRVGWAGGEARHRERGAGGAVAVPAVASSSRVARRVAWAPFPAVRHTSGRRRQAGAFPAEASREAPVLPDASRGDCLWCGEDITAEPVPGAADGERSPSLFCHECATSRSPLEVSEADPKPGGRTQGDGPGSDHHEVPSGSAVATVSAPDEDLVATVDAAVARRLAQERAELLARVDAAVTVQLERHRLELTAETTAALAECLDELRAVITARSEPVPTVAAPPRAALVESFPIARPRSNGSPAAGPTTARALRDQLRRYVDDVTPRVEPYLQAGARRARQLRGRVQRRLPPPNRRHPDRSR